MTDGILMEMTIDDVRTFSPEVVVIGIGSTEPHGPALPYGADFYQVDRLVRDSVIQANAQGAKALMYPTLPVGNNVNFKAFPFACRVSVQTLMNMLLDIIRALEEDGVRKIVLVNGHGGNTDAISATLRAHVDATPAERRAFVCTPGESDCSGIIRHASDHGGEAEASRMLYVREDLVRQDQITENPFGEITVEGLSDLKPGFVRPWHLYVPVSAGGDAREASKDKGRQLYEIISTDLARLCTVLSKAEWHENFPYAKRDHATPGQ